jgi:hypothetical protein
MPPDTSLRVPHGTDGARPHPPTLLGGAPRLSILIAPRAQKGWLGRWDVSSRYLQASFHASRCS